MFSQIKFGQTEHQDTMILDSLENAALYAPLHPRIALALAELPRLSSLPEGRYPLDGENVFALVQNYQTQPRAGALWEAHRQYIDLQFVVEGVEAMGVAPIEHMEAQGEYDESKDYQPFAGAGDFFAMRAGQFALLFPHDVHLPQRSLNELQSVKKIVIKIFAEWLDG